MKPVLAALIVLVFTGAFCLALSSVALTTARACNHLTTKGAL